MLEALKAVLQGVDGVKYVERQAISSSMVSEARMPALLIDEVSSSYVWGGSRAGDRVMSITSALAIEIQVPTQRGPGASVNESTVREAFVDEVIHALVHNPTLSVQLEGEGEACAHARDVGSQFAVRYVPGPGSFARALITLSAQVDAVYDRRPRGMWQRLLLFLFPTDETGDEPEYVPEIDFELT